jgi:peptidoglycan-N-acetylglucosamine deacetylase
MPGADVMTGRLYLTFDDGPDPEWTPRVLEELERLGTRATFFLIGERVLEHPEVVRQTAEAGHDLQLHCMRHGDHHEMDAAQGEADVDEALAALATVGVEPKLWRPPYLHVAEWSYGVAHQRGLTLTGGIGVYDWRGDEPEQMLAHVSPKIEEFAVIVLHDAQGEGAPRGATAANTIALLEPLVARGREAGLTPGALDEGRYSAFIGLVGPADLATTEIVDEDDLTGEDREVAHALLADAFPDHAEDYLDRGWRLIKPTFRMLARVDGRVVGVVSAFELENDRGLKVWGIGDGTIHPDHRGRGLGAKGMGALALEIVSRGPDVVVSDTVLSRTSDRLGGRKVEPGEIYWYKDGVKQEPGRHWRMWEREPGLTRPLCLEEGDF